MTKLTGTKRSSDKAELDTPPVIENVEFCMMQFYKMQWEGQQQRTAKLQKTNDKIAKVNSTLVDNVNELTVDLQDSFDIRHVLEDNLEILQDKYHQALHSLKIREQQIENLQFALALKTWDSGESAIPYPNMDEDTEPEDNNEPIEL